MSSPPDRPVVEFRVLGPLEVRLDGSPVDLGGPRQRAVLAALLLRANELATVDYLVGAVWGAPPATPESNLRTYVSGLRQRLGDVGASRLSTQPGGYLLRVGPGELDLTRFEELAANGEAARDSLAAAEHFGQALALWRDQPLAGLPTVGTQAADLSRLEEYRLAVLGKHIRARLDLGHFADLVPQLRRLVTEYPLREELWGHLMTALYRSGRKADALSAYQQLRQLLGDELGVTPGQDVRRLQAMILNEDNQTLSSPITRRTQQLPPAVAHFTGRDREIQEIVSALGQPGPPIVAVTGQPGAGKSTLAVRAAHQAAFPDGQLFVDLLGAGPRPRAPGDVLARFLRDLGLPGADIPLRTDERSAVLRDWLAGKRVLLVLDNAADEAQVRPLLPGSPGCAVIVTSRRRLTGLDVSLRIQLGELDPPDAIALLDSLAGKPVSTAETLARQRIAQLCGNLPLAIRIIGTKLQTLPHLSAEAVADRLADERHRLDEIVGGDRAVRAGFLVSYEQLAPEERRAFRLLALLPGTHFAPWAAAAALGTDRRRAELVLDRLVEANLVEVGVRYRLHDLIRLLAEERMALETPAADRTAALARVFEAYLHLGQRADAALDFGGLHRFSLPTPPPEIEALADEISRNAPAWFDEELSCVLDAVRRASAEGWHETTCQLSATLAAYLELRARWDDLVAVSELAAAAAREMDDMYWTAYALFALGLAARERRQIKSAERYFGECLAALPAANDPRLEMVTLLAVAVGQRFQGHYQSSMDSFAGCLDRLSTMDEPRWVAYALRELGILHRYQGDWTEADRCLKQAVDEFALLDDSRWEAACLRELGVVQREHGDLDQALQLLHRSRVLFHELGDVRREAVAWRSLAYTHRAGGDLETARTCCERSRDLFARTLDEHGTACTEVLHAEFLAAQGLHAEAVDQVRRSLAVFQDLGDPRWTGKSQLSLGSLLDGAGQPDAAREAWRAAYAILADLNAVEVTEAERLAR